MNITQFDRFRINSESSIGSAVFMDISTIDGGCSGGFMAIAYEIPNNKGFSSHKIEVRRKERQVALLTYKYSDLELPEYWRDAEVLHSWQEPTEVSQ